MDQHDPRTLRSVPDASVRPEDTRFQPEPEAIRWRMHVRSPPPEDFRALAKSEGRRRFWADSPAAAGDAGTGTRRRCGVGGLLRTAGTAAAVLAAIVLLNIGTVQFYLGQLIVVFLAISATLGAVRWARRGVRRQARRRLARMIVEYGGGIYGTVAVATFVYLQAMDIYGEIVEAGSVLAFLASITLGWLIAEAIEALIFGIQALLWPWYWFYGYGFLVPWIVAGGVGLVDGLRKPVRRWLAARSSSSSRCA